MHEMVFSSKVGESLYKNRIFLSRKGMSGKVEEYAHPEKIKKLRFNKDCFIEPYSTIESLGDLISIGSFSSVASRLPLNTVVGRHCSIGKGIKTIGFRHPIDAACLSSTVFNFGRENVESYFRDYENKNSSKIKKERVDTPQPQNRPIIIGHDVWIGNDVVLSGGIKIGNGSVIASGSVVVKDVPAYSIVGGNPAKFIRKRFSERICEGLEDSRWWEYEPASIMENGISFSDPEKFINSLKTSYSNIKKIECCGFSPYLDMIGGKGRLEKSGQLITHHGSLLMLDLLTLKIEHVYVDKIDKRYGVIYFDSNKNGIRLSGPDANIQVVNKSFSVGMTDRFDHRDGAIDYDVSGRQLSIFLKRYGKYLSPEKNSMSLKEERKAWEWFYCLGTVNDPGVGI